MTMTEIILASISPHRRRLLERLQIPFVCVAPKVCESEIDGEPPDARARRLAEEKAAAVAAAHPKSIVIGGDQTLCGSGQIFDKPGNAAATAAQLRAMSEQCVQFFTAVAVSHNGKIQSRLTSHRAKFRQLSDAEIARYIVAEPAFNCAGGAQIEGLGISLLATMEGGDPAAVVGMSLIELSDMLRTCGVMIP